MLLPYNENRFFLLTDWRTWTVSISSRDIWSYSNGNGFSSYGNIGQKHGHIAFTPPDYLRISRSKKEVHIIYF